jgi:hypothetical protein
MFSCQSAGYGNINFAVLNTGSAPEPAEGAKTASASPP